MSHRDESLKLFVWLLLWLLLSSHPGPVFCVIRHYYINIVQSVLSSSGSHIYIDAGEGLSSEASLTAVITQAATWKIKVENLL